MYNRYYTSARAVAPAGQDCGAALRPGFRRFKGFKGFRGCGIALAGDEYYSRSAAAANRRHYNSPLNQPGRRSRSRAEPIGQCAAHDR